MAPALLPRLTLVGTDERWGSPMARRLGLQVVDEMAETEGQVMLLAAHGCELVQGHYFSKALSAEACERLIGAGPLTLPVVSINRIIPPRCWF